MNTPDDDYMPDEPDQERPDMGGPPEAGGRDDDGMQHQQVQVPGVTARMPPSVGGGVFSTGAIVMTGQHAFVLDFLQQMSVPANLVSRVVLPHPVLPRFIQALEHNLNMFSQKFGPPAALPKPDNFNRPSVQEIYENLKLPDDELPGHYADGVVIRHSAAEFCLDFVTHFFPHAAVSRRIFLSAPHVPQLLQALKGNFQKFLENQNRPPQPPEESDQGGL